jgi:hypothetical protein
MGGFLRRDRERIADSQLQPLRRDMAQLGWA